jgi:hypothetical protein
LVYSQLELRETHFEAKNLFRSEEFHLHLAAAGSGKLFSNTLYCWHSCFKRVGLALIAFELLLTVFLSDKRLANCVSHKKQ